jgi:outer membrane lipoprotein-sorting protein
MIRSIARHAAALVLAASFALPAAAEYRLSDKDKADVARIEAYLNNIETLRSPFVQLASGGRFAEGTIYIERPRRLRLDYKPPATVQVYANGNWLLHVDTELETVTHIPISSTPVGFLVGDKIRFSGQVEVHRVVREKQTISVVLGETDAPEAGSFTLTFSDNPLQLRRWTVVDAQGVTTNVTLVGAAFNVAIPPGVFAFDETKYERELQ